MNNLKPIKLLPARERVAASLRKAILSRDFKEGEEIPLEYISEVLGVSTTPIREAFQILARDGLIKLRPNKGAVVLGINEQTIRDHYEVRAILEREAVAMVCRNNSDITEILNVYHQGIISLKNNNGSGYEEFNQGFHMSIWLATGNEKLLSLLSSLWNGLSIGHSVTVESYAELSTYEHKMIVEAIEARDGERAKCLMDEHIKRSMEDILTHFK